MQQAHYRNKKGNIVRVKITRHARQRFEQRCKQLKKLKKPAANHAPHGSCKNSLALMTQLFNRAQRVSKISDRQRKRLKKHGKDTLFFRDGELTFVVQDACIVTVEISSKGKRWLNKSALWQNFIARAKGSAMQQAAECWPSAALL